LKVSFYYFSFFLFFFDLIRYSLLPSPKYAIEGFLFSVFPTRQSSSTSLAMGRNQFLPLVDEFFFWLEKKDLLPPSLEDFFASSFMPKICHISFLSVWHFLRFGFLATNN